MRVLSICVDNYHIINMSDEIIKEEEETVEGVTEGAEGAEEEKEEGADEAAA